LCLYKLGNDDQSWTYIPTKQEARSKKQEAMGSPFFVVFIFLITLEVSQVMGAPNCGPILASDTDRIEFALNLEFLEAEFFLSGALGRGLDSIAPSYANGGPPPIGAKKANLDPLVAAIIEEFAYEEVGHLRSYRKKYFSFSFTL
jgi:hypothetical protein